MQLCKTPFQISMSSELCQSLFITAPGDVPQTDETVSFSQAI